MMSLEQIEYENKQAEDIAKAQDKQPYVAVVNADTYVKSSPYIGDYRPIGWKQIDEHFVDSSGLGSSNEPALTFDQFVAKVKEGHGYAIISMGQFQVHIAEFVKE